ncbi:MULTISPECIES: oxidoreductase [unclassified Variovorax]|uniref:oxidoreductase n=1 Tax=unclassified Variovorax TaxID=663243 RepID=UPI00257702F5|nr:MULTISPECIES: oxidoreductase [unclassified Variovorax]MDM0087681.1 oxidoreductase [Variovorax sp. J22G40]MDM0144062.1 oxidoreductase [Variovorax sp. J2P1-31]
MSSSPLRVGLIGYGFAGQTFHAPVLSAVPGLELAAVASSQPDKVRADWPGVAVEPDSAALLARADIDLVVIAAPNAQHHPLAQAALEAGRHVVVDKPFTLDADQARELAALAAQQGRLLSVYQNRRFDADFLTLRALLASGQLGRPVYLESHFDRFRPQVRERWREQAVPGAGLWVDLGAHLLDQAVQLFGRPDTLQLDTAALRDGAQVEDYFHAVLRYETGAHAPLRVVLHATTLAAHAAPRYLVHGTRGSYVKQGVDPQEDALRAGARPGGEDWGVDPLPGDLKVVAVENWVRGSSVPNHRGSYVDYYAAVRDAILGHGPNPVPPEEAVALMALLDLGARSAREGRALVP